MNLLPPLPLLAKWRLEGLSPQEIYARCEEMMESHKRTLHQSSRQEVARLKREQRRQKETAQIRSLREQNKTWQEIGQELGRSFEYLKRLAKEAGINIKIKHKPWRHPKKLPANEELAILIQTKTVREISDLYSVTTRAVYQRLDRAGIPRRRYKARGKTNDELGVRDG